MFRPVGVKGRTLDQAKGRGSLLLVEDEPFVAMLAQQILEDEGFEVTLATSGNQALKVAQGDIAGFSAAVVDMGLPDMRGDDLVRRLRGLRGDLPVLVASGYGVGELRTVFSGESAVGFVSKPYDSRALQQALVDLGLGGK